jgi:hypothetical protein
MRSKKFGRALRNLLQACARLRPGSGRCRYLRYQGRREAKGREVDVMEFLGRLGAQPGRKTLEQREVRGHEGVEADDSGHARLTPPVPEVMFWSRALCGADVLRGSRPDNRSCDRPRDAFRPASIGPTSIPSDGRPGPRPEPYGDRRRRPSHQLHRLIRLLQPDDVADFVHPEGRHDKFTRIRKPRGFQFERLAGLRFVVGVPVGARA